MTQPTYPPPKDLRDRLMVNIAVGEGLCRGNAANVLPHNAAYWTQQEDEFRRMRERLKSLEPVKDIDESKL